MKWEPGQAATIKTKNFVLRPLTPADVTDRFVSWFADPKVMQYVDLVMNRSRDQLVEFTSGFDNKSRFIFWNFPEGFGPVHRVFPRLLQFPAKQRADGGGDWRP